MKTSSIAAETSRSTPQSDSIVRQTNNVPLSYYCISTLMFLANKVNQLFIRSGGSSFGRALDPKDVSGHIDRHSRIFMDADTDRNRFEPVFLLCTAPHNSLELIQPVSDTTRPMQSSWNGLRSYCWSRELHSAIPGDTI